MTLSCASAVTILILLLLLNVIQKKELSTGVYVCSSKRTLHIQQGEGFFYLLDYVTPTENFQIGNCDKKRHGSLLYHIFYIVYKIIIFLMISDDTKNKQFRSGVSQNSSFFFLLKYQFFRSTDTVIQQIKVSSNATFFISWNTSHLEVFQSAAIGKNINGILAMLLMKFLLSNIALPQGKKPRH